ncbi:MAG: alpha/beta hydrolase [Flavobacterium sp.]|nr:MAG: alpha/beta hydrolase [Flavobacterium sp.]
MRKIALICLFGTFVACNNATETNNEPLTAQDILNASYGDDSQQKMDVYLPAGRNQNTKVIVLVHGGGWTGGSRSDFNYFIPILKAQFPNHAIVNMDYRLATADSPGFPKQIDDIQAALTFLKTNDYNISDDFAFIGASAGAHLSMLYAYKYDDAHKVKAVCSIVGPADFTDPSYTQNPLFANGLTYLVGNVSYDQNPDLIADVSPASHVTAQSPPTIMFYGGQDPLVPATQGPRLKTQLDAFGVYNELNVYPQGGHGNWGSATMLDFQLRLMAFLHSRFE